MARLTRTRARAPLADNPARVGWSSGSKNGDRFTISVEAENTASGDYRNYTLELTYDEAIMSAAWTAKMIAKKLGHDERYIGGKWSRPTDAHCLRILADHLEAEAKKKEGK